MAVVSLRSDYNRHVCAPYLGVSVHCRDGSESKTIKISSLQNVEKYCHFLRNYWLHWLRLVNVCIRVHYNLILGFLRHYRAGKSSLLFGGV